MKNKLGLFLTILITPMILTSCNNENKITVAEVTRSIFYAPMYVALNEGYFEDEGLDVEDVYALYQASGRIWPFFSFSTSSPSLLPFFLLLLLPLPLLFFLHLIKGKCFFFSF